MLNNLEKTYVFLRFKYLRENKKKLNAKSIDMFKREICIGISGAGNNIYMKINSI